MTALTLREIGPADYAGWFEANGPSLLDRSPFHDPAWLAAASRGVGFELGFIGAFDGDELTAVVPGFLARRGPFRLFGSPLRGSMTSYLGPVTLDPVIAETPEDLVVACVGFARRRWHTGYVRFTLRSAPHAQAAAPGPQWHQQRPRSYRLDLVPGEEALFAGFSSSCRRNVRKAEREGVEIVPFADARLLHEMLRDTFRRHASTSWHPARFFEALIGELVPRGLLWGLGARYDGRIIAAGLFLHDDREAHFLSGASVSGYGSLPTSYLLHWHAIARASREGLAVFNSEASGIRSIDAFKETFNPVLERRRTLMWAPRPVWTAQRAFMRWHKGVRNLRSRVATG